MMIITSAFLICNIKKVCKKETSTHGDRDAVYRSSLI